MSIRLREVADDASAKASTIRHRHGASLRLGEMYIVYFSLYARYRDSIWDSECSCGCMVALNFLPNSTASFRTVAYLRIDLARLNVIYCESSGILVLKSHR